VERVFTLHDLFMLIALPIVLVHIYLGSLHPTTRESLHGVVGGRVRKAWAREHHSAWLDEIDQGSV
jgi:formate dehydrogenase subunit gamma